MNIKNKEKDVSVWHAAPTSKVSIYYSVNDRSNKQYGGPSNRILYNIFFFFYKNQATMLCLKIKQYYIDLYQII